VKQDCLSIKYIITDHPRIT